MSTNPAFGTEEQVSGGGATSLASVRRHVFVCSEVCDGGALNRDASGAAARRFWRRFSRGALRSADCLLLSRKCQLDSRA